MKLYLPVLATASIYPHVSQAWSMGNRYYGFPVCVPGQYTNNGVSVCAPGQQLGQLMQKQQEMIQKRQEMLQKAFTHSSLRYEIINTEETFQIAVDVPGVDMKDIEVNFENDESILSVRGERRSAMNDSRSFTSQFSQRFYIDPKVDVEKFTASLKNGVLVISAPKDLKKTEEKVRKIPISEVGADDDEDDSKVSSFVVKTEDEIATKANKVQQDVVNREEEKPKVSMETTDNINLEAKKNEDPNEDVSATDSEREPEKSNPEA